jgi:hypothetical protein
MGFAVRVDLWVMELQVQRMHHRAKQSVITGSAGRPASMAVFWTRLTARLVMSVCRL